MTAEPDRSPAPSATPRPSPHRADAVCPVCGEALQQESCKVVCRSDRCVYRIVFNCSEF